MKKSIYTLCAMFMACAFTFGVTSCSDKSAGNKDAKKPAKSAQSAKKGELPNYRYVDSDTLLEKYLLAKDYQEEMLRLQNQYDNAARQQQSGLEHLAAQFQQKQQNNQYTSQSEYERDMQTLQQRQASAQTTLGKMQTNMQTQMASAQQAVQDSIIAYINEYNAAHGYDAIFMKAATLYIDPALDITDEILKGLNDRYNKVKK